MKKLLIIFLLSCTLNVTAQLKDSIYYDTIVVPRVLNPYKPVSSFSSASLKLSKIARKELHRSQSRFVKGDKYLGANISFGTEELDDEILIMSINLPKFRRNVLAASLVFGYFTSPTTAWGGRLMYNYGYNDIMLNTNIFGILKDEKIEFSYNSLMHRVEAFGFHRVYVPLGDKGKNFYFFNEISVHYGYQRSLSNISTYNTGAENISEKNTQNTIHRLGLGLAPGLTYFSGNRMALEFQLGTSGIEMVMRNAESDKGRNSHSVGFQFRDFMSILRIKMGVTFYFH